MRKGIVCLHGRAQEWQVEDDLRRTWQDAIQHGIKYSHNEPLNISNVQIELAYYGNHFRPEVAEKRKGIILQKEPMVAQQVQNFVTAQEPHATGKG